MKYEMIFGDQRLFDKATRKNTVAIYKISENLTVEFDKYEELLAFLQQQPLCDRPAIALRRIIAEPKRWTAEDKKAGRLPEIGSEVILRTSGEMATINAANKNMVCLTFSDGGFSPFNVERIDPIETPEEKAQREEDEWVDAAYGNTYVFACVAKDEKNRLKEYLRSIYKAQISGDLPAPGKE